MFRLCIGLFVFMYIFAVVSEEAGIVPNTRLERQEQAKIEKANIENGR